MSWNILKIWKELEEKRLKLQKQNKNCEIFRVLDKQCRQSGIEG